MSHVLSPSSATAFNILPIELNKAIVHQLDDNKDIATYRLICRATNDAVDADRLSFWRTKFREKYDFKEGKSNLQLRRAYQRRSKMLRRGTRYSFFSGYDQKETRVLEVLKDLIVEAFQGGIDVDENGRPTCKNQARLLDFVRNSPLLLNHRRTPAIYTKDERPNVNNQLAAIKLMCSHLVFGGTEDLKHDIYAFDEAQHAVYQSALAAPLYSGPALTQVNLQWMLHAMNFFRHHMLNEDAQTLFNKVDELDATQKPSAWREPLRELEGAYPLSKYWRGTYSFLENPEVRRLRKQGPGFEVFIDKNVDEGKIQSLELEFAQDRRLQNGKKLTWPRIFEDRLRSHRSPANEGIKTQGRNTGKAIDDIQFVGHGEDLGDEYMALGWLNSLPPQQGIPGWQRITFMKHFNEDLNDPMDDNLWAYEGVVLPGGRIILGRWWFASEPITSNTDYNGPFILWAVDEPEMIDDSTDAE